MDDLSVRTYVRASVVRSVCPVHCGKTADRIRVPFGIIGRTGPGMRQVVRFMIGSREGVLLEANLGRAIVTNGDFTAYVCDSAATRPSSQITSGKLVILPGDPISCRLSGPRTYLFLLKNCSFKLIRCYLSS